MNNPFPPEEYARRRRAVAGALAATALDGLLCLRPESRLWLAEGEPADAFECLLIDARGHAALLTPEPSPASAPTSEPADVEVRRWRAIAGADPIAALRPLIQSRGLVGARLGVELAAIGRAGIDALRLMEALAGICHLEDASDRVARLRAVKGPSEMACVRRAAGLADEAVDAALAVAGADAWLRDLRAEMHAATLRGGGDAPSVRVTAASPGSPAGERPLASGDALVLEWVGAYRQYGAALMRTLAVGEPSPECRQMHAVAADAMSACLDACMPGATGGSVFAAYADVVHAAGFEHAHTVGHGLGALPAGPGADWPLLARDRDSTLAPGMALLLRVLVRDPGSGRRVGLGQSVEITEAGPVALQQSKPELLCI